MRPRERRANSRAFSTSTPSGQQRFPDGAQGQDTKLYSLTARADGGEQPLLLRGHQNESYMGRRLLQGLEEGVLGLRVHGVSRVDDDDAGTPLERVEGDRALHLPYLANADAFVLGPLVRGFDRHHLNVGVDTAGDASTGLTVLTGGLSTGAVKGPGPAAGPG